MILFVLLLALTSPLRLTVSTTSTVRPFADVYLIVHAQSDPRNIGVDLTVSGLDYYRNSWLGIDGDRSPATMNQIRYPDVPAGAYDVWAVLFREEHGEAREAAVVHRLVQIGPPPDLP